METLCLVNGQRTGVDAADRGLAYGDGLFETMALANRRVRWIDWHFERLEQGCQRLQIPAPSRTLIEAEIAAHCPASARAVVKLIVTRGSGARGYRPPAVPNPTRILSISPWPDFPSDNYRHGIRVDICAFRLGENAALAGIKHLCRLEQVLAQIELQGSDAAQGLLLDGSGRVIGGTSSNVFIVVDGEVLTPSLARCGIKGVMRRAVITAATELRLKVSERDLTVADVLAAEEVFMTNALIGIWPVVQLDAKRFAPGAVTQRFMHHLGFGSGG